MFTFLDYNYDKLSNTASFRYQGKDDIIFTEKIHFAGNPTDYNEKILKNALFLAFVILGTSYYKAEPTVAVKLPQEIDDFGASFFSKIYQEGLSQFAFENRLKRSDLAHFVGKTKGAPLISSSTKIPVKKTLCLVSGGKDSLLSYEKLKEADKPLEVAYISASGAYPSILDELGTPLTIKRGIDRENLKKAGGLNGHVPVTLINEAIALIEAILIGANHVEFGIGREGLEPHAWIDDLPVNHQWSKTKEAQDLLQEYIKTHIATNLTIGSCLSDLTELQIAREFAEKCWSKYAGQFSSCNVANYKQDENNKNLKWCGKCAKCANSYLLFCPFIPYEEQQKIFGRDLFKDPEMAKIFKGLLGIDGVMKPFECIASIDELRWAYEHRLPRYGDLNF